METNQIKTFTVQDGINKQAEQLAQWKRVLKKKVYVQLEYFARAANASVKNYPAAYGKHIVHGAALEGFVHAIMLGDKPEETCLPVLTLEAVAFDLNQSLERVG